MVDIAVLSWGGGMMLMLLGLLWSDDFFSKPGQTCPFYLSRRSLAVLYPTSVFSHQWESQWLQNATTSSRCFLQRVSCCSRMVVQGQDKSVETKIIAWQGSRAACRRYEVYLWYSQNSRCYTLRSINVFQSKPSTFWNSRQVVSSILSSVCWLMHSR